MRSERHQRDQIESKVANLKPAKGSRPAELPKAGIDAETVAAAVGDIEKELTRARAPPAASRHVGGSQP